MPKTVVTGSDATPAPDAGDRSAIPAVMRDRIDVGTKGGTKGAIFDSEILIDEFCSEYPTRLDGQEWKLPFVHLVTSPTLTVVRGRAKPGTHVPLHHHSVNQITFVLAGELHYGNRVVKAGGGAFVPLSRRYSWTAGPDGAEILEIFDGVPQPSIKDDSSPSFDE
jgi:hypothetical protein